jgi:hypothetical protein
MRLKVLLVLFAVLSLCVAGCGAPEKKGPGAGPKVVAEDDWWNNPASISDYLAAVGSSPIMSDYDIPGARQSAAVNGRKELAATMQAKIQAIHENWSKRCADLCDKESFSSYMNDERFVREFVNQKVRGAYVAKYKPVGKTMYALVVLKNVAAFFQDVIKDDSDRLKKDTTLLKTEAMKNMARERLDKMLKEEEEKLQKEQHQVLKQLRGAM